MMDNILLITRDAEVMELSWREYNCSYIISFIDLLWFSTIVRDVNVWEPVGTNNGVAQQYV